MKLHQLIRAILIFLIISRANAVDISTDKNTQLDLYGRIYALDYIKGSPSAKDNASARLGLKTEAKITDNTSGYGRFEWQTDMLDNGIGLDSHYSFAGLHFDNIGSIDYGKNDGIIRKIAYYTDVLAEFSGGSENYTILGGRTANLLTYSNRNFFCLISGFDFALQYAESDSVKFKDESENLAVTREAYGLNGQYLIFDSGVKIGAAYAKAGHDHTYIGGINYIVDNVYLGIIFNQTIVSSIKYTGYEMVFAYGADFEVGHLTSSIAYISHETETTSKIKYIDFGQQYDMNKSISLIFNYQFNLLDNNNDKIVLGLIYYL